MATNMYLVWDLKCMGYNSVDLESMGCVAMCMDDKCMTLSIGISKYQGYSVGVRSRIYFGI